MVDEARQGIVDKDFGVAGDQLVGKIHEDSNSPHSRPLGRP